MGLNIQDLAISSPDIATGSVIADAYVAEGGNQTPQLVITGVPADAVELAVILHDPDAPIPNGFTHWTVYGIDPKTAAVEDGRVGPNGIGEAAYTGPQPPPGHGQHHYYFWVYALNR